MGEGDEVVKKEEGAIKEVLFKDGRVVKMAADFVQCPAGCVSLYKRIEGMNQRVASYPAELVKDVRDYRDHPAKMLAVRLMQACSNVPHGSRKLCVLAGVQYSDLVIPILKKLREAGKVEFHDGKWTKA